MDRAGAELEAKVKSVTDEEVAALLARQGSGGLDAETLLTLEPVSACLPPHPRPQSKPVLRDTYQGFVTLFGLRVHIIQFFINYAK